ncbi:MAG: alpha/beta fold hydrolase [Anaerolineae bacterium]
MPHLTFDQRFANVPAAQREALQRFGLDHPYTERLPDGTSWRYIAMGTGRRLVVLLPHALFPADSWLLLANALQGEYRLLIPDGYALQKVYEPERIGEALVQMIQSEGGYSATVVAHSTGGSPAQWFLHRWPHRIQRLALCHSPALAPDTPLPYSGSPGLLTLLPAAPVAERTLRALAPNLPAEGEWLQYTLAYLRLCLLSQSRRALAQTLRAEHLMRARFAPEASSLRSWPGQLLVVTAQDDPYSVDSVPLYQARYPGVQASRFDAGGHWTHLLYPELFNRRILRFLSESAS